MACSIEPAAKDEHNDDGGDDDAKSKKTTEAHEEGDERSLQLQTQEDGDGSVVGDAVVPVDRSDEEDDTVEKALLDDCNDDIRSAWT